MYWPVTTRYKDLRYGFWIVFFIAIRINKNARVLTSRSSILLLLKSNLLNNWLILSKLCFKPSAKSTSSIMREDSLPILPIPMIFPFELSPNLTFPPSYSASGVNFLSLVMCLEHPLSRNYLSFVDLDIKHT